MIKKYFPDPPLTISNIVLFGDVEFGSISLRRTGVFIEEIYSAHVD